MKGNDPESAFIQMFSVQIFQHSLFSLSNLVHSRKKYLHRDHHHDGMYNEPMTFPINLRAMELLNQNGRFSSIHWIGAVDVHNGIHHERDFHLVIIPLVPFGQLVPHSVGIDGGQLRIHRILSQLLEPYPFILREQATPPGPRERD